MYDTCGHDGKLYDPSKKDEYLKKMGKTKEINKEDDKGSKKEDSKEILECPHCEFKTTDKNGLAVHIGRMHKTLKDKQIDYSPAAPELEIKRQKPLPNLIKELGNGNSSRNRSEVFDFLMTGPVPILQALDPEKLKQLIINERANQ